MSMLLTRVLVRLEPLLRLFVLLPEGVHSSSDPPASGSGAYSSDSSSSFLILMTDLRPRASGTDCLLVFSLNLIGSCFLVSAAVGVASAAEVSASSTKVCGVLRARREVFCFLTGV